MSRTNFAFINDAFLPRAEAALQVDDLSIQRAYGIFDFFKFVDGRALFLDDHLARFDASAARMRLPIGKTREQLKQVLAELIVRNDMPSSGVRLTLTGGYAADGYTIATPNLVITQRPLPMNPNPADAGIRLASFEHQRQLCEVKTIDYLMAIWLHPLLAERGAGDVLYHQSGIISECPRSNIFLVTRDGRLVTPGRNILEGVIRKHVIALAAGLLPVEQRDVRLDELHDAREAFVTSTTKGLLPVASIDGRPVGDGRLGEATRALRDALEAYARAR